LRFNINLWGISCYNNNIINLILILGHDYDMINRDHFTNIIYI
jgi:hypothetical protein